MDENKIFWSDIIPFLTTLKSFKFGFNTPLRAEIMFINTKDFLVKWGTKSPINLPHQLMPGGLPIRCFGTYTLRVSVTAKAKFCSECGVKSDGKAKFCLNCGKKLI
ncbi:MAG: SPFH domain-containing protein [Clostridium sp.]